jgi:hypothetical protein
MNQQSPRGGGRAATSVPTPTAGFEPDRTPGPSGGQTGCLYSFLSKPVMPAKPVAREWQRKPNQNQPVADDKIGYGRAEGKRQRWQ